MPSSTRSTLLPPARLAASATAMLLVGVAVADASAPLDVWIGTTGPTGSDDPAPPRGVYHATLDPESGELTPPRLAAEVRAPGFLATHPTLPVLYSTGRQPSGDPALFAWRIERPDGVPRLAALDAVASPVNDACHIAVDRTGSVLLSAHYGGGAVAATPLRDDGALGPFGEPQRPRGASGVVPDRQAGSHPHWVGMSPDNRFVLSPDLGRDRIDVYGLGVTDATLAPHGSAETPPGGGPRHLAWAPDGRHAYVVDELTVGVSSYAWDAAEGRLALRHMTPLLTDTERAAERFTSGSEVAAHPSGRFVYAAVRGHDTIAVLAVDPADGRMTLVEREPVRGSWPRHFALSPEGEWLVAAGRDTDTLTVFEIDPVDGRLTYTLEAASVPRPICVLLRSREP